MGRYYSGDIEGKFWFAVQSSDDASFFGAGPSEPNHIDYYFDESNLAQIKAGIAKCKKALGENKKKLDDFFAKNQAYNDEQLSKECEIKQNKIKDVLEWYARLRLGEKILRCVKKKGECSFEAEL